MTFLDSLVGQSRATPHFCSIDCPTSFDISNPCFNGLPYVYMVHQVLPGGIVGKVSHQSAGFLFDAIWHPFSIVIHASRYCFSPVTQDKYNSTPFLIPAEVMVFGAPYTSNKLRNA